MDMYGVCVFRPDLGHVAGMMCSRYLCFSYCPFPPTCRWLSHWDGACQERFELIFCECGYGCLRDFPLDWGNPMSPCLFRHIFLFPPCSLRSWSGLLLLDRVEKRGLIGSHLRSHGPRSHVLAVETLQAMWTRGFCTSLEARMDDGWEFLLWL
jgi:hypothetical protein